MVLWNVAKSRAPAENGEGKFPSSSPLPSAGRQIDAARRLIVFLQQPAANKKVGLSADFNERDQRIWGDCENPLPLWERRIAGAIGGGVQSAFLREQRAFAEWVPAQGLFFVPGTPLHRFILPERGYCSSLS